MDGLQSDGVELAGHTRKLDRFAESGPDDGAAEGVVSDLSTS